MFSTDPSWKIKMKRGFLHVVPSTKINHIQSKKEMVNFIRANLRLINWRRKRQPTPVFLPGESQGQRSPVGCRLWGRMESDTTEAT